MKPCNIPGVLCLQELGAGHFSVTGRFDKLKEVRGRGGWWGLPRGVAQIQGLSAPFLADHCAPVLMLLKAWL